MAKKDLGEKKITELRTMAKKKGIPLKRDWKKADIVKALLKEEKVKKEKKTSKAVKKVEGKPKAKEPAKKPKARIAVKEKKIAVPSVKKEFPIKQTVPMPPMAVSQPPELPEEYGENRITLMTRDPQWLYAYWEVKEDTLRETSKKLKGGNLCLRVYDVTGVEFNGDNANRFLDINVYERIGNWYIDVRQPDSEFIADIGVKDNTGHFMSIARSNKTSTPKTWVSKEKGEQWIDTRLYKATYGLASEESRAIAEKHFGKH